MARETHLRVVGPGMPVAPPTPETITEALEGSSRDVLAATRQMLARKLDAGEVSSNAIATVSRELRELDRLIRAEDASAIAAAGAEESRARRTFNASAL